MRFLAACAFGCLLFGSVGASAQERAKPVSLIQLVATPERFDGKLVMLQGFVKFDREPKHGVNVFLYLHEEDAKNRLVSNSILVIPSKEMLRDEETLNGKYVHITARFQGVRAAGEQTVGAGILNDVKDCDIWLKR